MSARRAGACMTMGLLTVATMCGVSHAQGKRNGAILPGGDSKKPINIEAAKLDYFDKEQRLIYTGSVVATQGDSTLKSSALTILLAPKSSAGTSAGGASSNQVQHMVATGPVTMLQRDQVGTGDNAVYDKSANTVVLTGNVVLTQGDNVTKGDKLVYDLKTGHATVTGQRVVGMFKTGNEAAAGTGGEASAQDVEGAHVKRGARKTSSR